MSEPSTTSLDQMVRLGPVEDFPLDEFRIVEANSIEIGVLRTSDGFWAAVRNICPHRYAPVCLGDVGGTMMPSADSGELVYGMDRRVLRCPWHHWEFDLTSGKALFGISRGRLKRYPLEIVDGEVWVGVSATRGGQADV